MSDMDKLVEATDETAQAMSETLHNADIRTARELRIRNVSFGIGTVVGLGIGGAATYFLTRRRLETKFSRFADDEIEEMRSHYESKVRSLEAQQAKGDLEDLGEIVAERGYSPAPLEGATPSPMAITPPAEVMEAAKESEQPSVIKEEPAEQTRNVFQDHGDKGIENEWDMAEERKRRSPDIPYVIHIDERGEFPDYDEATLTYYEGDDVLCNERDEIVDPEERDALIGEQSLNRFGHGSNDPSIVWVRNDRLELQYEIVKSPNSYAEEVHGFAHYDPTHRNLERMRTRERNLDDDG